MGESKTNTMNSMSKLAQFRPKGSEFQEKPHSFQHVPASVKVSALREELINSLNSVTQLAFIDEKKKHISLHNFELINWTPQIY